jgi:hypothetical protein
MGLRIAAYIGCLCVAAPLVMGACTAEIGGHTPGMSATTGGSAAAGGPSTTAGTGPSTQSCQPGSALAKARLWRLTDAQYVNAVRQVFGVEMPSEISEADAESGEYTNFSEVTIVNDTIIKAYQAAGRDAARQAVKSHFGTFMACGTGDACVEQFVRNRVARAFGRRLDGAEVADYVALYKKGAEESPEVGVRLMIEATLQSPSFLYRTELGVPTAGGPTGQVQLTAHEIATSLSFSLTNSVPDEQLWQKADTNALAEPAVLAAEVDRLLELPETKANLAKQAGYWLGVERLKRANKSDKFPEFTPALKATLYQSAQLFVQDLVSGGSVNDLVTSKKMYVNEAIASVYGISGVTGADLKPIEVTQPERANGILTQPAVLAALSRADRGDPIHRGLFIFYSLACAGQIPPPPPGALDVAASFPPESTERELAGFRAENGLCKACHSRFDPMGLLTERYDAIGRYQETNASGLIDQSSTIAGLGPDLEGPSDGIAPLASKLLQGRRLSDCAASNLAVFTLGRDVKTDTSCALSDVKDTLAKTGKFRDFYKALATSPAFVLRDVE